MEKNLSAVNELLAGVFNDILNIEEKALKNGVFNDVSVSEAHTIEAIGMYEPKNMSDVARRLSITVGTLTVAVTNLVKKGYVIRERCVKDRRVVNISLTKKGRVFYRFYAKVHSDMIKEITVGMSEQEVNALNAALSNLSRYLIDKYNKYNNIKRGEAYV